LFSDGLHQPVLCHDQLAKGVSTVITMTLISPILGTHMSEHVAPAYRACVWKQRPAIVTLGGFPTDNSTSVSAARCRHHL
jgi:hypothetical protein